MFTQGHRDMGKLEYVQSFSVSVVKLHEAAQMFVIADYVRKMTEEVL